MSKGKSASSNLNILNTTNPEIFDASPRPGGFLNVMVPTRSQDYMAVDHSSCPCHGAEMPVGKKSGMSVPSAHSSVAPGMDIKKGRTTSREFRLKTAIEETDWEDISPDDADKAGVGSPIFETINMLAVTISCVMMMASNQLVPPDYLTWAQNYLECIRDDDGYSPPNIQRLISEILKRQEERFSGKKIGKKTSATNAGPKKSSSGTGKKSASSSGKLNKSNKSLTDKGNKSLTDKSNKSLTKTSKSASKSSPKKASMIETPTNENVSTLSAVKPSKSGATDL